MFDDWDGQLEVIGMVAIGGLLGATIGLEREFAGKPAGLRTHALVCAAATLLMVLGRVIINSFDPDEVRNYLTIDPIRVMQAIVIGISFLGAGTIFRQRDDRIEGLTTAASILFTAGIGIAVGVEKLIVAGGLTVLVVVILLGLGLVEHAFASRRQHGKDCGRRHPSKRRTARVHGATEDADGDD